MLKSIYKSLLSLRLAAVVLVLTVLAWHLIVNWLKSPLYLFPTPLEVAETFGPRIEDIAEAFLITFYEAIFGFAISVLLGTLIGMVFGISPFLREAFSPHVVVFQTIPIVAISPLLCIWFGNGTDTVLAIVAIVCLPSIIINTTQGLVSVEQNLLDLFKMGNASPLAILFKLRFPHALPSIFTGLRIAAGAAVVGATVGENFAGSTSVGKGGLGYSLYYGMTQMDTPYIFCLVAASAILGFGLRSIIVFTEWMLLKNWHSSYGESTN